MQAEDVGVAGVEVLEVEREVGDPPPGGEGGQPVEPLRPGEHRVGDARLAEDLHRPGLDAQGPRLVERGRAVVLVDDPAGDAVPA